MIARTTRWASACLPLLTAIAALAGCDESPTTIQRSLAPSPGRMVIISGDGQSAPAGTELPQPLVVRVLDGAGEPIEGQIVNFRVTAGGGSVLTGASTTGADGATEDRWTLGTAGTAQEIEARAVDAATGTRQVFATFTATAIDPATIVASVVVSPAEADLTVGGTQQLNAVARNAAGGAVPGKTFEWSSSNTAVATVSATGLVTAHAPGTVTVSAAADELSGSASLEVAPEPEVDTDPPGTPGIPTVAFPSQTSDSVTVTATWTAAADGAAYRWSAGSNAGGFERIGESTGTSATFRVPLSAEADGYWFCVRAVDDAGNVGAEQACNTFNTPGSPPVEPPVVATVAVAPGSVSVVAGATTQLTASARDDSGDAIPGKTFSWTSSNTAVATVSSGGLVTARAAGSATISASVDGVDGTASVTVTAAAPTVATVAVSPTSASLTVGDTRQLSAAARDADGNTIAGKTFTWSSSNTGVATVSSAGLVTARAAGSATISASVDGKSGTAAITVQAAPPPPPDVASIAVSPASATLEVGGTRQLSATARDEDGNAITGKTFTWSSNSTSVATVNASGLVTARAAGSATISASVDGKSGTSAITVEAPPPPEVATVAVSPGSASLEVGATRQLSASARDAGGNTISGKTFSWSSSDTGVATVSSSGLVTARGEGDATITASVDGRSGSSDITVSEPAPPPPPSGDEDVVEDFNYSSVSAMLSSGNYIDYEVKGAGNMSIISDGYNGSNAVRSTWPASYSGETRLPLDITDWSGEWWVEYYFRIGSTWSMTDVESWKFMAVVSEGHSWRLEFSNGSDGRGLDQYISSPYQYAADAHKSMSELRGTGWHRLRIHFSNSGSGHFDIQMDDGPVRKMSFSPQSGTLYYISPTGLNRNNGGSGVYTNDVSHLRGYFSNPAWSGF